jgi:hypothetical protein
MFECGKTTNMNVSGREVLNIDVLGRKLHSIQAVYSGDTPIWMFECGKTDQYRCFVVSNIDVSLRKTPKKKTDEAQYKCFRAGKSLNIDVSGHKGFKRGAQEAQIWMFQGGKYPQYRCFNAGGSQYGCFRAGRVGENAIPTRGSSEKFFPNLLTYL